MESVRFRSVPIPGCPVDQHGNQNLMMKSCANRLVRNNAKYFATAESVLKAFELSGRYLIASHHKRNLSSLDQMFMDRIIQVDRERVHWTLFGASLWVIRLSKQQKTSFAIRFLHAVLSPYLIGSLL